MTCSRKIDAIDNFIDYIELYNLVKVSFNEERFNLLEPLANKIINNIIKKYESVFYIKINIRKPSISIDSNENFINVEVKYKQE